MPYELLYNKKGEYVGFYSEVLKRFRTLYDYIRLGDTYDKDMIASSIWTAVEEFERIGLNYYDIHDENFMIGDNGEFKVVDVDGADQILTDSARIDKINNYWDLIFEMYLFSFYPEHPVRLNCVWLFEEADTYFTHEFLEYLDGVIRDDRDILTVSPKIYLPELYDTEKISEFSKRLEMDSKYYGK